MFSCFVSCHGLPPLYKRLELSFVIIELKSSSKLEQRVVLESLSVIFSWLSPSYVILLSKIKVCVV